MVQFFCQCWKFLCIGVAISIPNVLTRQQKGRNHKVVVVQIRVAKPIYVHNFHHSAGGYAQQLCHFFHFGSFFCHCDRGWDGNTNRAQRWVQQVSGRWLSLMAGSLFQRFPPLPHLRRTSRAFQILSFPLCVSLLSQLVGVVGVCFPKCLQAWNVFSCKLFHLFR